MTRARADTVDDHKLQHCHEAEPAPTVLAAIQAVKPTVYLDIASVVSFPAPASARRLGWAGFTSCIRVHQIIYCRKLCSPLSTMSCSMSDVSDV